MAKSPFDMLNSYAQFNLTLGEFLSAYTRLEIALAITVRKLAGVSTPIAKALFSGLRADAATKCISQLLIAQDATQEVRQKFTDVFAHLGQITLARNTVLHYGTDFKDDAFLATNSMSALTEGHLKAIPLSVRTLRNMATDCQTIEAHLWRLLTRQKRVGEEIIEQVWGGLDSAPWLYKPPLQSSEERPNRSKSPKQQPQLRPSKASRRKAALQRARQQEH